MAEEPEALIARLAQRRQELAQKQVVAGFDGFIDSIQKVILHYPENLPAEYFKTVGEFGQYISDKKTGGLSLETEEITKKIAQLITPPNLTIPVDVIFQTIESLHESCPNNLGDWYFTGNYPTPGGNRVCNKAFMNYMEGKNSRGY